MMNKRKICFITERRADYSRLKPVMKAVNRSRYLEMQLVLTGAHLLKEFGKTQEVVKQDGFKIDATLPIFRDNDPDNGKTMIKAMGRALIGFADILPKLKPDIIFAGFDIGANFAAAIAGMHLNIHVSHIQGGEVTGTVDEVIRHGLTKFAHIHFAATQQSAHRIIKLGEDPKYVFMVGSPSIDTIRAVHYQNKRVIFAKYGLDPQKKLILFLQHPVTTEIEQVERQIMQSIKALTHINNSRSDVQTLAIYSNNDAGGKRIIRSLKKSGINIFPHVVYEDFLNLMKYASVLVGNSSAGIHEAPSFCLPTVNIGTRQQFRERGKNVLDVDCEANNIIKAIKKALFNKQFISKVKKSKNPYDHGFTADRIVKILETIELPPIQKVINY